jgi:hypothetical protein
MRRSFLFGPSLLVASLAVIELCVAEAWGICLMTQPCSCRDQGVVYCVYRNLKTIPFYGEFPDVVWKQLDLSENFLSAVPNAALKGVRVTYLKMKGNLISDLHPDSFEGIQDLEILDLSHNYLSELPPHFLHPLQDLRLLELMFNQISEISPATFWGATRLKELDLTGNELTTIPDKALRMLTGLERLILRSNKLKKIQPNSFYHIPLQYLDVGDNGAPVAIDRNAFCGLDPKVETREPGVTEWTGLTTLRLDHNGLNAIDPCITKLLWTLTRVDLSGNPLHCTCNLLVLVAPGSKTDFPAAQCALPSHLAGQYLDHINVSGTRCSEHYRSPSCSDLCTVTPPPVEIPYELTKSDAGRLSSDKFALSFVIWALLMSR